MIRAAFATLVILHLLDRVIAGLVAHSMGVSM